MPQKKILVVDADVASRNFISTKLFDQNYDVLQAGSGREGLISAWRDRPDLLIVDPVMGDLTGEEFAARLRNDPRTANVPLVALSGDPSYDRSRACFEAGFNEYIQKSGQAVSLLTDALTRLLGLTEEAMKQGGLLIVFLSAKGGSGTSSMCANIALSMAQLHPESRIAVLDLVLPIGSIAPIVGYNGPMNIVSIADMPPEKTTAKFFKNELPKMDVWQFSLLAGPPDPERSNQLNVGRIWDIVTALKETYDYVLVDIGRALSKITLPLIQHAEIVTLLISTDISALPLTKTLLHYLNTKGVHSDSIYSILNRSVGLEGLSKGDAETSLGIKVNVTIPYLGTHFAFANSQHQPFALKFPNNTASIIFHDTAKDMTARARKIRDGLSV